MADLLDSLGYYVISIKGSGARGVKMRKRKHPVIGDLLAIPAGNGPWLQIEVGSHTPKHVFASLSCLPGFTALFVQYFYPSVGKKGFKRRSMTPRQRVYTDPHTTYPDIIAALVALSA